ncbi:protein winged eye [Anopheles nili]|uniref:protein winged eye n=1 Tax=Anopheles nili TaxID=185578 RepID=UPI00237A34E8|nr:protein winged eye [Anopheles nili]
MLGSTANGRLMGPGVGSSTSSSLSAAAAALQQQQSSHTSQQYHPLGHHPFPGLPSHHHHHHHHHHQHHTLQPQHPALPSHHHRSIWPSLGAAPGRTAFELQTAANGEVTESLFAAGGYNTPPASSPFLPCSPLELVAKNFHTTGAALSFSQANSSIFVQSQTDFINGTTAVAKKTETCIGRWEHGTIEPLQIQVPASVPVPVGHFALESPAGGPFPTDESPLIRGPHPGERWLGKDQLLESILQYHQPRAEDTDPAPESTALLSPTSPTSSPSEYCRLKRKLHSLLLESSRPSERPSGVQSPQTPLPEGCPEPRSAAQPPQPAAQPALTSAAINQRPRRRWAALHLQHASPEASEGSAGGRKSPGDGPVEQRLPKKRRLVRPDRTEQPAIAHRDTDHEAVVHIKREPCQVSEVTTSNSYEATTNTTALNAIIKIEASSPKAGGSNGAGNAGSSFPSHSGPTRTANLLSSIISNVTVSDGSAGSTMEHLGLASTTSNPHPGPTTGSTATATIPVGIAVARQRLQESSATPSPQLHQTKELNRFSLGLAAAANGTSTGTSTDLGCATPGLSQSMFFTGTNSTMIPLSSDAVAMGVTNAAVQNAVRTPPALWQYPAPVPMESMLPLPPIPPVGFQLMRDPSTGQILFLPAAAAIANPSNLLDKIYISCIEPFQQAVVWPSYPQSSAALQSSHLLLPQLPPTQLQPPPLAPLQMVSSDYLTTASTTLHQQHTQTHHSTRYLALTSDSSGKRSTIASGKSQSQTTTGSSSSGPVTSCGQPTVPLPMPAPHAFIKLEDCSTAAGIATALAATSSGSSHLTTSLFGALSEADKAMASSTTVPPPLGAGHGSGPPHLALSSDISPQLLFQSGNLIHITTPHHAPKSHSASHALLDTSAAMNAAVGSAVANPTPPPSAVPTTVTSTALLAGLNQATNTSSAQIGAPELPTAATCLTPPPDTTTALHETQEAGNGETGGETLEPPEVQDANIQTDTPIMSEDETTQPPGGADPEATTEATLTAACHALATEQPLCHSTLINNSGDSAIEPDMSSSCGLLSASLASASNCDQVDMELEAAGRPQTEPENLSLLPGVLVGGQRRIPKLEVHSPTAAPGAHSQDEKTVVGSIVVPVGVRTHQEHPVDLSGLELLSHSIEVFQKKSSLIKKEPISPQLPIEPPALVPISAPCQPHPTVVLPASVPEAFLRADEPMGGLNLLCALAEQRFQEEGMYKKDSPSLSSGSPGSSISGSLSVASGSSSAGSPPGSPPNSKVGPQENHLQQDTGGVAALPMVGSGAGITLETIARKRKHHKHSKDASGKRSSKRSKHEREQRRAEKRRKQSSDSGPTEAGGADGELDAELKDSLTRVKAKLNRCSCKDGDEKDHRCCRTQWPTANELFSVIESDMKERLERITRQCEEKKRELEQMSTAAVAKVKPLANSGMVRIPEMGKAFFGGFGAVAASGGMLNTFGSGTTVGGGGAMLGHGLGGAGPKFSTIPALSPNFSSSSNSTTFVELPKLSSDTDSSGKREDDDACSMERLSYSKRKGGIPKKHDELTLTETIVAKKPKSLVGYILASKNTRDSSVKDAVHQKMEKPHHNHWSHVLHQTTTGGTNGQLGLSLPKQHHHISESKFKKSPIHSSKFESTTSDDTSNLSDSSLKPQVKIRSPAGGVFAFEDENSKPSEASFSIFGGKPSIFDKVKTGASVGPQVGPLVGLKVSPVKAAVVTPLMKPQQPTGNGTLVHAGPLGARPAIKRKKSRSKDRKRRSSEKKRIDQRCLLTSEHLGKDKTRVLTAMGGLFYAGCLSAVQPPDIYAVTLDGERGNRPHIMSREEVLRDAILEVAPKSVDDIIPGTRLCAYWSQQYRCLYPGVAAEPASPDPEKRFVNVEFDDGDNGKIALEDIRFLMSDYPIVEYDPNPLLSLGKRKRQPSHSELACAQFGTLGPVAVLPNGTTSITTSAVSGPNHPPAGNLPGQGHPSHTPLTATVTPMMSSPLAGGSTINSFALATERAEKRLHDEAYREERRRLKKIRKDKLRRLAANNAELASMAAAAATGVAGATTTTTTMTTAATGLVATHKHKKSKTKCYDEFCKHRKHKKRRKHKKHHRIPVSPVGPVGDVTGSMDDDISQADSASQTAGQFSPARCPPVVAGEPVQPAPEKEDTLTEEEVSSSVTESSGSYYQPQKKTTTLERKTSTEQNGSKIAAFLPARQLWAWCGKGYKRSVGRVKKQFYKSIQRGKETISVGDSAVFLSTGRPDRPYIGHIESMWETSTNSMVVRVKWFYHPEETQGCPNLKYPGALFQSPHEDENDVQTISHKCEVLSLPEYTAKFGTEPKQYSSIYDNNDTYYLAGYYDPTVKTIKMQPEIEVLPPNVRWVTTTSSATVAGLTPAKPLPAASTTNGIAKASSNGGQSVVSA